MGCARQDLLSEAIAMREPVVDEAALDDLVRRHARFVYRLAFSVLRNHHDAEDATQETFLRVLRHRDELRQVQDARLWLARIAWRIAVDRARKQPEQSLDQAMQAGLQFAAGAPGMERKLIEEQNAALLERLVRTLPRDLRHPLALSTVEEMSHAAIAEVMGIPEASVRQRLFRARQLLREKVLALMEGRS